MPARPGTLINSDLELYRWDIHPRLSLAAHRTRSVLDHPVQNSFCRGFRKAKNLPRLFIGDASVLSHISEYKFLSIFFYRLFIGLAIEVCVLRRWDKLFDGLFILNLIAPAIPILLYRYSKYVSTRFMGAVLEYHCTQSSGSHTGLLDRWPFIFQPLHKTPQSPPDAGGLNPFTLCTTIASDLFYRSRIQPCLQLWTARFPNLFWNDGGDTSWIY